MLAVIAPGSEKNIMMVDVISGDTVKETDAGTSTGAKKEEAPPIMSKIWRQYGKVTSIVKDLASKVREIV